MTPLVIVGAGGLGRETTALVDAINAVTPTWDLLGFIDDDPNLLDTLVCERPILGDTSWLRSQSDLHFVLSVGSSQLRHRIAQKLEGASLACATLVHPSIERHPSVEIGAGSMLFRGAVLMLSVTLGMHVVIDVNCTVGHDSTLQDFSTLHPGSHVSGNVRGGVALEVGTGGVVLPGVSIGDNVVVGAGAVVHRPLPAECTAVGVPAHPINDQKAVHTGF